MKQLALFVPLIVIIGCSILSTKPAPERKPSSADDFLIHGPPPTIPEEQRLSFDRLQKLILSAKTKSVEESMAQIGPRYPEYLKLHTLMYKSLSIQESSYELPRVIAFGPDARFVLTFNGSSKQKGGNAF